jgi:HEAT repeat protein
LSTGGASIDLGYGIAEYPLVADVGESGVESLISRLSNGSFQQRWTAADALGDIGDPRAVEPLVAALENRNPSPAVRESAAAALVKIGAPAVEPLIALLSSRSSARLHAAEVLGNIGDPRAVEPLTGALENGPPPLRRRAEAALEKLGRP